MFKYSLFICKCSERESHFDCHIDCHFDCNLQLIVNFLGDKMSELKGVRSGAERMKKYRAENKQKCDLTNLKQNFRRSQLLGSGTPEGEKMRKAAAERKRLQRSSEWSSQDPRDLYWRGPGREEDASKRSILQSCFDKGE